MKRVAFVGGAAVGLGFLQTLLAAHEARHCELAGAIPAHKSESKTKLIATYADEKRISIAHSLGSLSPLDLVISAGNHMLFKKDDLALCPIINFHAAPLPEYRGSAAMAYAILNDEKQFGVTYHYVTPEIDIGAIVHEERFPVGADWTAGELDSECARVGIESFCSVLIALLNDKFQASAARAASKPAYRRDQMEAYREIDLGWPAEKIWRHVRACDWDGVLQPAFLRIGDKIVYLTARQRGSWI